MTQASPPRKPVVDWLTVAAIAAIAISVTVATHEGVHALTCVAVGGDLQEYSALYASCDSHTVLQGKAVAGAAPLYNLLAGLVLWIVIRRARRLASDTWYFLWLLMFMNLLYGSGYLLFSGLSGIGDLAVVVGGWEPGWFWRVVMTIVGVPLVLGCAWLALRVFGQRLGGDPQEQTGRAKRLFVLSYVASVAVILIAGLFNPMGFLSLPVMAGLMAVVGTMSPLLWMMRWFKAEAFVKLDERPLEIQRRWAWVGSAAVVVFLYAFVLGRTLYF